MPKFSIHCQLDQRVFRRPGVKSQLCLLVCTAIAKGLLPQKWERRLYRKYPKLEAQIENNSHSCKRYMKNCVNSDRCMKCTVHYHFVRFSFAAGKAGN